MPQPEPNAEQDRKAYDRWYYQNVTKPKRNAARLSRKGGLFSVENQPSQDVECVDSTDIDTMSRVDTVDTVDSTDIDTMSRVDTVDSQTDARLNQVEHKVDELERRKDYLGDLINILTKQRIEAESVKPELKEPDGTGPVVNGPSEPLTLSQLIQEHFTPVVVVRCFIVALTVFLVIEQTDFYILKKYSLVQSIGYALLLESSLVFTGWLAGVLQKEGHPILSLLAFAGMIGVAILLGQLVQTGVVKRSVAVEGLSSDQLERKALLRTAVNTAQKSYDERLAEINLLAKNRITDRNDQRRALKAEEKVSLDAAVAKYDAFLLKHEGKSTVGASESNTMIWIRWVAIFLNMLCGLALPFLSGTKRHVTRQ